MKETGNPALEITLSRAVHDAEREAYGLRQSDPKVAQALHEKHVAEEKEVATKRLALNRQMEANRALQKARHETAETMAQLKRAKLQLQTAQSILETESAIKSFSVEMLGNGRNRGGGVVFRKNRMEVMDRLCKISELTGQERNHYNWFKEKWGNHMANEHSETWGQQFAEIMQSLLEKNKVEAYAPSQISCIESTDVASLTSLSYAFNLRLEAHQIISELISFSLNNVIN